MADKSTIPLAITTDRIGVKAVTLRRWCDYHSAHLSPGANPPTGQARRFSNRDIEVLKTVRDLRQEGFSVARINEKLAGITFAVIDTEERAPDSIELAPPAVPDGLQQAPAPIVAHDYIITVERRLGALERRRLDNVTAIGLGFVGGLLFAAILIGLAALYGSN